MDPKEHPEQKKSVSLDQIGEAIGDAESVDDEFWEISLKQGEDTFSRGYDEASTRRQQAIEMVKVALLLGSLYLALYRFGGDNIGVESNPYFAALPFIFLSIAVTSYILGYYELSGQVAGPSSANLHSALESGYDSTEYKRIMSAVYFKWSDDNMDLLHKEARRFGWGTAFLLSSLVAIVLLVLLG
ncbi:MULTISPECIES: hypothetical protein [unclassified Haloarcula]|jgi:hypothetical protein|uniref:hypothetical protein n=1 Tax=unclassified Haloarcula TaxID=2624677 RepID=UPI00073E9D0A|nr:MULTISPECIES: hypothetical protein [unclassified Haloarcula]